MEAAQQPLPADPAEQGAAIDAASSIEGQHRFFFRGPFGNRLELLQFIGARA